MGCLDENQVVALFAGALGEKERAEIDVHVDFCGDCRALLAAAARALPEATPAALTPGVIPSGNAAETRFENLGMLGRGGMGEVFAVRDRALDRVVALKRIQPDKRTPDVDRSFLEEARLTAQLEHPNIVPVHDVGQTESGDPFFTLKRVEGRSLQEVLRLLAEGDAATVAEYPLFRLAIVYLHVVNAIAYAHARGVVHCDLKPSNILLGRHGEVLLTDWGLARRMDGTAAGASSQEGGRRAQVGGTLRFMAPEQLRGTAVDARTDVFGLGALLYVMLTLRPAFTGATEREIVADTLKGEVVPPSERAPDREVPPELERLCLRALAREPEKRPASALEVREAVEAYLAGSRRRQAARERFEEGERARARWAELAEKVKTLEAQRHRLASQVKTWDGETKKAPLWRLAESLDEAELQRDEALSEALDNYSQAVGVDEGFAPAAERLADLHLQLFLDAERQGDRRAALIHRRQVERHHRGRHRAVLEGKGRVRLAVPVPGARVSGRRLVEQGKRIVEGPALPLGEGSGAALDLELPVGSYLFVIEAPDGRLARLPLFVDRNAEVSLRPRLFDDAQRGPGFVHVSAGPFQYGGDRIALNAVPRREVWLEDFFIARFPVTCAEYVDFLNALAEESPHLARKHSPRTRPDGGFLWDAGADGRFGLPRFDADGNPVHPQAPVMGVSFEDACLYADWRARKDGVPYRLPTEEEWEKAARGADGRFFPWGNGFDPSFCKMAQSRPDRPQPEPVGSFPVDTSVYGMQDAAGGIREWCDSFFDEGHSTRVLRGGAWYFNPHYCRLAFRHGYLPYIVFTNFGFRLCHSPQEGA